MNNRTNNRKRFSILCLKFFSMLCILASSSCIYVNIHALIAYAHPLDVLSFVFTILLSALKICFDMQIFIKFFACYWIKK